MEDAAHYPFALPIIPKRLLDLIGAHRFAASSDLPDGTAATAFRVDLPFLAQKIVMESDVLGLAVPKQVEHEVAAGRLAILPLEAPWLKTYYGVVRLARRTPSPSTEAFIKVLHEVEREIDAETNGSSAGVRAAH
jgi:DNA-binding transcriptional LysR family regulator